MLNHFSEYILLISYHMLLNKLALLYVINADPQTEEGSHKQAIRFQTRSSTAFYFDSYVRHPYIATIQAFLRRNYTVSDYNTIQLQGLTSTVCGNYCCLFALHMDRGYTPKQFVGLCTPGIVDQQISLLFTFEFGSLGGTPRGQCCTSLYKW